MRKKSYERVAWGGRQKEWKQKTKVNVKPHWEGSIRRAQVYLCHKKGVTFAMGVGLTETPGSPGPERTNTGGVFLFSKSGERVGDN